MLAWVLFQRAGHVKQFGALMSEAHVTSLYSMGDDKWPLSFYYELVIQC